jgi:hypothetical protein
MKMKFEHANHNILEVSAPTTKVYSLLVEGEDPKAEMVLKGVPKSVISLTKTTKTQCVIIL